MIKRVNPFVIVGVFSIILLVLFLSVQNRRHNIHEQSRQLAKYEAKAKGLKGLKSKWQQKNIVAKLNAIVSNPSLKKSTDIKKQGNRAIMSVKNIDKNQIDMIMKNMLNEPFNIKKFDINRLNDKSLNLTIEVAI